VPEVCVTSAVNVTSLGILPCQTWSAGTSYRVEKF